jgi:anti-anti-sigma regulatory factor
MRDEPALCPDDQFIVSRQRTGSRLAVTLSGRLDLDSVEELAACTDQICRSAVQAAIFDVTGVTGADEAGARTLAAAFRCLASHDVSASVCGVGAEVQAMLDRLGLALPAPLDLPADATGAPIGAVPVPPSADLVGLGVTLQGTAGGLGVGDTGRGNGSHDRVELPGLLRGDAVEQRPSNLLDV